MKAHMKVLEINAGQGDYVSQAFVVVTHADEVLEFKVEWAEDEERPAYEKRVKGIIDFLNRGLGDEGNLDALLANDENVEPGLGTCAVGACGLPATRVVDVTNGMNGSTLELCTQHALRSFTHEGKAWLLDVCDG